MSRLIVLVLVAVLGAIANKSNEVNEGEVNEVQETPAGANNVTEEITLARVDVMNKKPGKKNGKKGRKGKGGKQNKTRPTPNEVNGNKTRLGSTRGTWGTVTGCSEIPSIRWGRVSAGRTYQYGHNVPELSCSGSTGYYYAEQKYTATYGHAIKFSSFIVNAGCSVYFFSQTNYGGAYVKYTGPRVVSNLSPGGSIMTCGGAACVSSMLWTCKQTYPSCTPTDSWQTIAELDNSGSAISTVFTYEKTVGTTFSQSMTHSMSVSLEVSAEWEVNFWLKTVKMGVSLRTGYDWSKTNSETKSKAHTFTVELTVPAKKKAVVQEAVGTCGGSVVHTQLFRVYNKN